MGETAELMQDGVLCEGCGVFLGVATGHPRRCADCKERDRAPLPGRQPGRKRKKRRGRKR